MKKYPSLTVNNKTLQQVSPKLIKIVSLKVILLQVGCQDCMMKMYPALHFKDIILYLFDGK